MAFQCRHRQPKHRACPGVTLGGSYAAGDGLHQRAPQRAGLHRGIDRLYNVDVRRTARSPDCGWPTATSRVETARGPIATSHVVLTGGPQLGAVGAAATADLGRRHPASGGRHRAVDRMGHRRTADGLRRHRRDLLAPGEFGGVLWDEQPGRTARGRVRVRPHLLREARTRIEYLFPPVRGLGLRRTWAATIDYTNDHLPILGPLLTDDGPVDGTVVAGPAGHGMMGPGGRRGGRRSDAQGRVRLARPDRPRTGPLRCRRQQPLAPSRYPPFPEHA